MLRFHFHSGVWSPQRINIYGRAPDLDAFDAEAQGGRGAERLPPLHVSGLEDSLLGPLLHRGRSGVHRHHLVIHVLPQTRMLPGFFQFLLQVRPGNQSPSVLLHKTGFHFLNL